MKTFHRFQAYPSAVHLYAQHHSRWKRKNKYRQYKHTITKLKAENEEIKAEYKRIIDEYADFQDRHLTMLGLFWKRGRELEKLRLKLFNKKKP